MVVSVSKKCLFSQQKQKHYFNYSRQQRSLLGFFTASCFWAVFCMSGFWFHYLVTVRKCLAITRPAIVKLQHAQMNMVAACREINLLTGSLSKIRSDIKENHWKWYSQIAGQVDASIKKHAGSPKKDTNKNLF